MDARLIVSSFFETSRLRHLAGAHRDEYATARPFPHVVIDDFLPAGLFDAVVEEFPEPGDLAWDLYTDRGNTEKLATADVGYMGPMTRQLFAECHLAPMVAFLEELTGITGLLPDPYLVGGGLHLVQPGGFLNIHADFNVHARLQLDRRINLLLYLNPNWQEQWDGHLELWNETMMSCEKRIAPLANRCVIFNTTDTSFHGHPTPLRCPPGVARRSLALYYYSNGRPEQQRSPAHSTLYQVPGARPTSPTEHGPRTPAPPPHRMLRRILPPVLVDAGAAARGRFRAARRREDRPRT